MINKLDKNADRTKRHLRVRKKISGTQIRPRLNVYRSTNEIYAQIINDENGTTLVSANSKEKALVKELEGKTKTEKAYVIVETVAKRALEKGISTVVFDRGGYLYTGRVKSLADGARNAGLEF